MRHLIILSLFCVGVIVMISGCSSVTVTTWVNPSFDISKYKRAFIKENEETEGYFYDRFEDYLESISLETGVYSSQKKITRQDIIVDINTVWGISLPYGHPYPHNFKYPKSVTVEFLNGATKEKLLKTVFTRNIDANIEGKDGNYPKIIIKDLSDKDIVYMNTKIKFKK